MWQLIQIGSHICISDICDIRGMIRTSSFVDITLHRKVTKLQIGLHAQLAVSTYKCDDLLEDGLLEVGIWHGRARANSFDELV